MSRINPYDAIGDNVDRLLKAWREQIEIDYQRILAEGERLREQDAAARKESARDRHQEAMDAAIDHSVADYLEALVSRAQHIDVGALQIPAGVRSVTSSAAKEITALSTQILRLDSSNLDDPAIEAQRMALGKLSMGLLPHPGDLETVMRAHQLDAPYADRFGEIAQKVDKLDRGHSKIPQLQAQNGFARLELLRDFGELLAGYSTARLVGLVVKPSELTGAASLPSPTAMRTRGMNERDFNSMLNQFVKR